MVKILAISHSASNSINRSIYLELAKFGFTMELVVPKQLNINGKIVLSDPQREADPIIHFADLIGTNPRIYTYHNLMPLLNKIKPCVVILENDPISKLATVVGKWCKVNKVFLTCQSCENLPIDFISQIKRLGIKSFPVALTKWYFKIRNIALIDCVFTINSDGTKIFRDNGFRNVVQIPLGFDPSVFFPNEIVRDELRLKLGITGATPVFAYFGRLAPEKGVHLIVESLSQIVNENWFFMIDKFELYKSPYSELLIELIKRKGVFDKIIFIDADHLEVAQFMNAADLVIIPSLSTPKWKEQYGRVAPEAMACGKLVCVSDSGALKELVGNAGLVLPEGDVNELKNLLLSYCKSPGDYMSMKINAHNRAFELLTVQKQALIIRSAINSLI